MGGIGHMGFVWESREKFSFSQLLSHLPHLRMLPQDLPKISQSRFSVSVHQAPDSSPKKYIIGSNKVDHLSQPLTAPFLPPKPPTPDPYSTAQKKQRISSPTRILPHKKKQRISSADGQTRRGRVCHIWEKWVSLFLCFSFLRASRKRSGR